MRRLWVGGLTGLAMVAGLGCTEDTLGLGPGEGGACDDGIPCTLDRVGPDGACEHAPRDDWCQNDPCARGVCRAGAGCEAVPEPNGTICANGPACQPYVCTSGQCGQIVAPDGSACVDPDPCTTGERCEQGECVGTPTAGGLEAASRTFLVDAPRNATFISDWLAVEIAAGGSRLRRVERDGEVAAPTSDLGISMDGSGRLVRIDDQRWLRLNYAPASGSVTLEVIFDDGAGGLMTPGGAPLGSRSPEAPALVTAADGAAYFCLRDDQGQDRLHALSLAAGGPLGPAVPIVAENRPNPCAPGPNGGTSARGAIWATWSDPGNSPQITVYRAGVDGVETRVSFSYVTDGVHRYGGIEAVAADDDGTVIMPVENPQWAYVFDLGGTDAIETTRLDRPTGARLLGLRDRQAIFHHGSDLLIYDITDVGRPGMRRVPGALATPDVGPSRLLDADDAQLALVDGAGRLHWFVASESGPFGRSVDVRGQAVLQDVTPIGGTFVGWSERHLVEITPSWLGGGGVQAAPLAQPRPPAASIVGVSSAGGSVLLGRSRYPSADACRAQAPGRCPADGPSPGNRLALFSLDPDGLQFESAILPLAGPWSNGVARGLLAWHVEPMGNGSVWAMVSALEEDRLIAHVQHGTMIAVDELADTFLDPHRIGVTIRRPNGAATLYQGEGLGASAPLVEVVEPGAIGAAWFPPYWSLILEGGGGADTRRIVTFEVDDGQARRLAEHPFDGFTHRVVGQAGGVLYTEEGSRLEAWRLAGAAAPESLGAIETVSPVTRVVQSDLGTLAVRPDGVTVLTPECR